MTAVSPPKTDGLRILVGISVCLLANVAMMYGVLQSPYGSLGFFDDSPATSDWLLPMAAGAVLGLLQTFGLGVRPTLISASITAVLGVFTLLFLFPAVTSAIGCALGGLIAFAFARGKRWPSSGRVPMTLLAALSLAAVGYGATYEPPPSPSLLDVKVTRDGPAALVDKQERAPSTVAVGTLADVDGCLGLIMAPPADGAVVVFWPLGTSVSSDPFTLTFKGDSYDLGDKVAVEGALLTFHDEPTAYRDEIPESCATHDLFM